MEGSAGATHQFDFAVHGLEFHRVLRAQGFDLGAAQRLEVLPGLFLARGEAQHFVIDQVIDAVKAFAHADRPGHRRAMQLEHRFDLVEQFERIAHFPVHLVDEGDDRRVAQAADFQQLDGLFFDAFRGIHHHHGGIDSSQHSIGVFREVLVAGCVEQVDHTVVIAELHHRTGDRNAALLFHFQPVRGGVFSALARFHRARHLDCATEQQQLFGQRGLARVRVGNDGESAPFGDLAGDVGCNRGILIHDVT